ncbi:hypothetical protein ACIP52_33485 [Streptomyces sp. NPDC088740]|uniref:hypothetical protein n=2 Tax=Streptomyces TaxID=1883 RepID=UPI0037FA1E92
MRMGQHADAVHLPFSAWATVREPLTARGSLGAVWADGDDIYVLTAVETPRGSWPAPARCIGARWITMPADPAHAQDLRLRWLNRPIVGPLLTPPGDLRAVLRRAPEDREGDRARTPSPSSLFTTRSRPMSISPSGSAQDSTLGTAPSSLTIPQGEIAGHVVRGAGNREIAAAMYVSASTVGSALSAIRKLVNCPPGASRPVLALAVLRHGQTPPPAVTAKAAAFTSSEEDLNLMRAHAEHSRQADIAQAVGLSAGRCRTRTDILLRRTGLRNSTDLVVMAHTRRLLPAGTASTGQRDPTGNLP